MSFATPLPLADFLKTRLSMKLMIVLLCLISSPTLAQVPAPSAFISVIIKVPWGTSPKEKIYLKSVDLCPNQEICVPLHEASPLVFVASVSLPLAQSAATFEIHRGKSSVLAVDQLNQPIQMTLTGLTVPLVYSVVHWSDQAPLGVVGNVQVFPQFYSPQLHNHRTISVWLPPGYETTKRSYPVIYMHDGRNDFDPLTSTTGVDWQVDDIMSELVLRRELPPAIIVAVDCDKAHRYDEYDYTIQSELYAQFLIKTVKPFVDQSFRTLSNRENTFVMGSSMGGYISLALVWKHSEVFSKAAALSLPVFIHNSSIYKVVHSSRKPRLPTQIYMDHGSYNDDAKYAAADEPFHAFLLRAGYAPDDVPYFVYPFADHREVDWARRVAQPLHWLLLGHF